MNLHSTELEVLNTHARSSMYKLLAKSFLYPTKEVHNFIHSQLYQNSLDSALVIAKLSADMEREILTFRELISARQIPAREELEKEYNRLFAHLGSAKCPPYETEYGYDNIFQKTEAMADIAGFYRAYELEVSEINTERVDFISMELEFMSYLALKEAYAHERGEDEHLEICIDTQREFLRDHLGRWMSIFTKILANSTENAFYLQLGKLTEGFVALEAQALSIDIKKVDRPWNGLNEVPAPFGCDSCVLAQPKTDSSNGVSSAGFDV